LNKKGLYSDNKEDNLETDLSTSQQETQKQTRLSEENEYEGRQSHFEQAKGTGQEETLGFLTVREERVV
jgi:hypothetical protein